MLFILRTILWLHLLALLKYSFCTLSVTRIVVRTPKEGDIGLIFDISILNTAAEEKQMLGCRIRPDGECCVNLSTSGETFKAGKVLGGSFGNIEAGAVKTVSVIWPTTVIFNRVGHCDVLIRSHSVKQEKKEFSQRIHFDTRFETIDSTGGYFTKRSNYVNCGNWDLNYFKNCSPINCEEKYLGKRSFFNLTTKRCEEVPKCLGKDQIYDIYSNECSSLITKLTAQDIDDIKHETSDKNNLELKSKPLEVEHPHFQEPNEKFTSVRSSTETGSIWHYTINILGVVFATIIFYTGLCFVIFLLVNKISGRS